MRFSAADQLPVWSLESVLQPEAFPAYKNELCEKLKYRYFHGVKFGDICSKVFNQWVLKRLFIGDCYTKLSKNFASPNQSRLQQNNFHVDSNKKKELKKY